MISAHLPALTVIFCALALIIYITPADAQADSAYDCCLKVGSQVIPKHVVLSYRNQIRGIGCTLDAVVFTTRKGRKLCAPSGNEAQWVEELTRFIDNRLKKCKGLKFQSAFLVRVNLNRSLELCVNETSQDCCPESLCVQETLRVSACADDTLETSIIIQTQIYAQIFPSKPLSENLTVIPNQVFQPLGRCPCDVSPDMCDIRCCCDPKCTQEMLELFSNQCLPGPFGGSFSPVPDYQCLAQSSEIDPDWFPFLCVVSPSDNNPFLGLFYNGGTVSPKLRPSFQTQQVTAPVPPINYHQGDPIFTEADGYFTIPQNSGLGQCVENAPVAFLENFESQCVTRLQFCPSQSDDPRVKVKDGRGGSQQTDEQQSCILVLSLRYTFYWRENGLTGITVLRTTANISTGPAVSFTSRYSAVFMNGNETSQPYSGNPGYQVQRSVIGGILDYDTGVIQRAQINLWQPGGEGLCSSADLRPVLFGINSTSGCLISASLLNLMQCSQLRETVRTALGELVTSTLVSRTGKPDFNNITDWLNITFFQQNSSQPAVSSRGVCADVPTHLQVNIRTVIRGSVQGVPQKIIQAVEISFRETTWRIECDVGGPNPCLDPEVMQNFAVTSSVTFTEYSLSSQPPRSRFSINFTEFDCDRNDVCWNELAFPLTRYYTGEPYSQALAKGLILVFFFIVASVLGTPWSQIRQAWRNASL
ncbi:Tectonic-2 Precursor [Triplophysa tibetana]|uniref:C-C motif chemokine n=1 Tax=Triplophysa tibetana TaxID=1572043 RepID=A0A5A9P2T9_9TELE|nr:Tectonic-2 Precursor [Triplophysa tibetana]